MDEIKRMVLIKQSCTNHAALVQNVGGRKKDRRGVSKEAEDEEHEEDAWKGGGGKHGH